MQGDFLLSVFGELPQYFEQPVCKMSSQALLVIMQFNSVILCTFKEEEVYINIYINIASLWTRIVGDIHQISVRSTGIFASCS